MTQLKEKTGCNEEYAPESDLKSSPTEELKNQEKKSIDFNKISNRSNEILVYIAGCASAVGFVSDGITGGAMVGAAVGAVVGAATGIISVSLGKQDSEETA
ncbi:MAG: hypothetical protein SXA11_24935 [Cyanobacteriota bacterium]|nr:hypothetical protein [Cyanobacteriota bacterium]